MPAIEVIYFNAGGGHRAAAHALEAINARQQLGWALRCRNLFEILDPQGQFRRIVGIEPEDIYNVRLRKGWTAGLAQELKLFQATIRLAHPLLVRTLEQHWLASEPDLVVSVIPNFNRALAESLSRSLPGVPLLTVMTDLADYPPHFWIEPGTAQHIVCGTDRAEAQARAMGVPAAQVHRVTGMLLHPDFHETLALDRSAERQQLGLDPGRPTGIVLFGGHGSATMETIACELDDVQLVLMCGQNAALARRLSRRRPAAPHAVLGFTREVRRYLQLGDFFIGKPGPGSLSEATHLGLPVITFRNAWTMPQERYNTEWVREHGLGLVLRSPRGIRAAVHQLLAELDAYRARVSCVRNRARFELPAVIGRLLTQAAAGSIAATPAPRPALQAE
jgi:hypothetical protein